MLIFIEELGGRTWWAVPLFQPGEEEERISEDSPIGSFPRSFALGILGWKDVMMLMLDNVGVSLVHKS